MKLSITKRDTYEISNMKSREFWNLDITLCKVISAYLTEFRDKYILGIPSRLYDKENAKELFKAEITECIDLLNDYMNDKLSDDKYNLLFDKLKKLLPDLWN